jgi:hypothetical protein
MFDTVIIQLCITVRNDINSNIELVDSHIIKLVV